MVTKQDAMTNRHFWLVNVQGTKVITVRASGKCQTWKMRPNEFRLPVKYGLYESAAITHDDCERFYNTEVEAALKARQAHR